MTDQHRATFEQWEELLFSLDPLVARVEALENRYETQRLATLEWGKDVDNHGRWIDDHLKRIMALETAQQPILAAKWRPLRTETTYGEASATAQRLVRDSSLPLPVRVEGSFDLHGKSYTYRADAQQTPVTPTGSEDDPIPADDSLVERVSLAIDPRTDENPSPLLYLDEARAAIRGIAEWLAQNGWGEASDALMKQQANR